MVNGMKKNNRLGFTLVELLAVIVLLGIVAGITGYAITNLIKSSKEKDYELLVSEVKDAVEVFYQECKYSKTDSITCPEINNNSYKITLGELVKYGFIKGNLSIEDGNSILVNPKDNVDIMDCEIIYNYNDKEFSISNVESSNSSCPTLS